MLKLVKKFSMFKMTVFTLLVACDPPCVSGQGYCVGPNNCTCVDGYKGVACKEKGSGKRLVILLAHLSHWLMVSYCDRWMSVIRCAVCVVLRQQLLQMTSPSKLLAGF